MKILALITARGGSKRLPGKNIRALGGKPLIVWSIDVVNGISEVCDILVSTDDPAIASVSEKAGALVPWLRPAELATDSASSVDVALHALDWYETNRGPVNGLLLLQPTSPFRSTQAIRNGIELFTANRRQCVVSVSLSPAHPMWTMKLKGKYLVPYMKAQGLNTRSQDLPSTYVLNGSIYLVSPEVLRASRSFVTAKAIPLFTESPQEALDIDNEWDFRMAEMVVDSVHEP